MNERDGWDSLGGRAFHEYPQHDVYSSPRKRLITPVTRSLSPPSHIGVHSFINANTPIFNHSLSAAMQTWKSFSANLPAVDMTSVGKGFRNTVQATRCVGKDRLANAWMLSRYGLCNGTAGTAVTAAIHVKEYTLTVRERLGNVGPDGITE